MEEFYNSFGCPGIIINSNNEGFALIKVNFKNGTTSEYGDLGPPTIDKIEAGLGVEYSVPILDLDRWIIDKISSVEITYRGQKTLIYPVIKELRVYGEDTVSITVGWEVLKNKK